MNKKIVVIIGIVICVMAALMIWQVGERVASTGQIQVFLQDDVAADALRAELIPLDGIQDVELIPQHEGMVRFQEVLGISWEGENPLPDVLALSVNPSEADRVHDQLQSMNGIEFISFEQEALRFLAYVQLALQLTALGLLSLAFLGAGYLAKKTFQRLRDRGEDVKGAKECGSSYVPSS